MRLDDLANLINPLESERERLIGLLYFKRTWLLALGWCPVKTKQTAAADV